MHRTANDKSEICETLRVDQVICLKTRKGRDGERDVFLCFEAVKRDESWSIPEFEVSRASSRNRSFIVIMV
jgi:hypothetical protein